MGGPQKCVLLYWIVVTCEKQLYPATTFLGKKCSGYSHFQA